MMLKMEDIKMWVGELLLENKQLQKELERLETELEQIKERLLESSLSLRKEEKENQE